MNENLDLTQILKDCPEGTKLYSPIFGEVTFHSIRVDKLAVYPIRIVAFDCNGNQKIFELTKVGGFLSCFPDAECLLFPSKDNRDWSTFKPEQPKPKFEPFQRVLVRTDETRKWQASFFSHYEQCGRETVYMCTDGVYLYCIPYEGNEHLLGTTDEPK